MSEDTRVHKSMSPAPSKAMAGLGLSSPPAGKDDSTNVFGKLFDLANSTASQLEALWEEVGCTAEDRKEHLHGLVVDFERLCQEKVREEESVRDQFKTNIAQLQQELTDLTSRLKVSSHPTHPPTDLLTHPLTHLYIDASSLHACTACLLERQQQPDRSTRGPGGRGGGAPGTQGHTPQDPARAA